MGLQIKSEAFYVFVGSSTREGGKGAISGIFRSAAATACSTHS